MISTAFQLSPHYGTFRKDGGFYDIRFEREYAHPAARVWDAITDAEKLAQWFGGEAEIEPRVGGRVRIQLLMTTVEGTVTGIEPGRWSNTRGARPTLCVGRSLRRAQTAAN